MLEQTRRLRTSASGTKLHINLSVCLPGSGHSNFVFGSIILIACNKRWLGGCHHSRFKEALNKSQLWFDTFPVRPECRA